MFDPNGPRLCAGWADRAVERTRRRDASRSDISASPETRFANDACTPPVTAESRGYGPTRRTRTVGASYGGHGRFARVSRREALDSSGPIRPRNPSKRQQKVPPYTEIRVNGAGTSSKRCVLHQRCGDEYRRGDRRRPEPSGRFAGDRGDAGSGSTHHPPSIPPTALFLGWLALAPIFADSTQVSAVGRAGVWVVYTAPCFYLPRSLSSVFAPAHP